MKNRLIGTLLCLLLWNQIATAANVVWVHQMRGQEDEGTGETPAAGAGTLEWEDDQWRVLLEGAGHNIIAHDRFDDLDLIPEHIDTLNSADIVLFSRDTNSGDYNEPAEQEAWAELVNVPMIIMTPYVIRSNRWDMVDSTAILDAGDQGFDPYMEALVPDHPVFEGALDGSNEADIWDEDALGDGDNIDFLNVLDDNGMVGNGQVLAIDQESGVPWMIYWEEGVEYYDDSVFGFTSPAPRLYYSIGSDDDPYSWGEKNTTEAGDQILLNSIDWMTGGGGGNIDGDFDGSGALDAADINALTAEVASDNNTARFDVTGDGIVDAADINGWVKDLKNTWLGDANLDGEFNSGDFVDVFTAGKFEQDVNASWEEGDWNGDARFDSGDFVTAFTDGGFENGPRAATAAVPEPNSGRLLMLATLSCLVYRRKR